MSAAADVVVAGGGIAGLTVALALADAGARVLVADEPRPGAASRASAGMLAASFGFPPAVQRAALAAREAYPALLDRLHADTGCVVPLDRRGIIELPGDGEPLRAPAASSPLDAAALAELEPAVAGHREALLHPLDGSVEPAALMDALDRAVERHAGIRRERTPVVALRTADAGYSIETDRGRHSAPRLVLATGAWAGTNGGLRRPLPVRPVHGELLLLPARPLGHVVYGAGGYLIPRRDGILVGATSEERGFDASASDAGRRALLAIAERLMPSLRGLPVLRHWAGLRPVTPDGLPILGADPADPGLAYACGLSRNGILFAPWAAGEVAREVMGGRSAPLAPFRVERFANVPVRD